MIYDSLCGCRIHSLRLVHALDFLTRRLLRMFRERVLRVAAQASLGIVTLLLSAALDIAALVVGVAGGAALLGVGLLLWLGGLATSVLGGHDCDVVCVGLIGYVSGRKLE